ncbi:regulation of nuclear pre-mRNA domain-containing protein 1B-like [Styela clava]|uniref:regulation of nuclear pre-mRNA domain-containing protein 1B-like n=1 Tax=Styela clava TaxID=7725 RepID=UPI0019397026|nr:regulation of nuclear pre-mRNA domain-containing protein 1B-like [Styela clava]
MSSFSEAALVDKLSELTNSMQIIQTLSLWLIHHRRHSKTIIQVWQTELIKAKTSKKLTFLYLANDILQNCKKKGPEFHKAFGGVLITAFTHVAKHADEKTMKSVLRILDIWQERAVFEMEYVNQIRKSIGKVSKQTKQPKTKKVQPTKKVAVADSSSKAPEEEKPVRKKSRLDELITEEEDDDYLTLSPRDPPEAEDLVKALTELENAASTDAAVREKIASLPPEVQDISRLDKIADIESAEKLSAIVDEACLLLAEYNGRLVAEIDDRRQVARMLSDYIRQQKSLLQESEDKLQEYRTKLAKVSEVRKELKSHLQNLPDLTMLPSVTGGLAPLPSAGDLFN